MKNKKGNITVIAIIIMIVAITTGVFIWIFKNNQGISKSYKKIFISTKKPVCKLYGFQDKEKFLSKNYEKTNSNTFVVSGNLSIGDKGWGVNSPNSGVGPFSLNELLPKGKYKSGDCVSVVYQGTGSDFTLEPKVSEIYNQEQEISIQQKERVRASKSADESMILEVNDNCKKEDNCCTKDRDCEYIWITGKCNTREWVGKKLEEARGGHYAEAPPRENVTCTCENNNCITHN